MNQERDEKLAQLKAANPDWGRMRLSEASGIPPATVQRWLDSTMQTATEKTGSRAKLIERIANSSLDESELSAILRSASVGACDSTHDFDWEGETIRVLAFSDTHIGNKIFRDDWWYAMWDAAVKHGAEMALFGGDFLEGPPIRGGHIYECSEIGWDAQKTKAFQLLDEIPLEIEGVMGNHDLWFMQKGNSGINPGKELGTHKNFNYLGDHFADLTIGNLKVRLHHGLDGAAYALGYRPQKIIESIPGGEKPHVLMTGHDHKQGHFHYRNVQAVGLGTLCPQTKWMQGKRIQAACGFYIIDLEWNDRGLLSIAPRWFPFYE